MVSVIIVIEKLLSALLQRARTSVIRLLSEVWDLGDVGIGLMTIFNLAVLFPLSNEALSALAEYEKQKKCE